jgi:hypothetical protein
MSQKFYNFLQNRSGFLQMKRLVFVQVNLRLVEGLVAGAIDIIKVPTLLAIDEKMEDHYAFLQDEDAQRQEHTQRHQAQMIVSFANLMASNSSLECSMSLDLGFDTIDVVEDGERNG